MPILLNASEKDLGEFSVRRILPNSKKNMVGPFIFFDHMGPAEFAAGQGINVRPHPHIGIATITYLFEGSILHRDSLGYEQEILPGDINWMTAGNGIVHSERETAMVRNKPHRLHGLQLWIALPDGQEEIAPAFTHHPEASLPKFEHEGAQIRLMAGELYGKKAPIETYSPMFYADINMPMGSRLNLPGAGQETAIYVINGQVEIDGAIFKKFDFLVLNENEIAKLSAVENANFVIIGGAPFATQRHIFWNFVSSSTDRIEKAKNDWRNGNFPEVPGDNEFIPLPG